MNFVNVSKNTIRISDLNMDIPYLEDMSEQHMSVQNAKKSFGFRRLVASGLFKITKHNNSLFERNLIKLQKISKNVFKEDNSDAFVQPTGDIEVKIRGSFLELGGYAKVNRNLAQGLHRTGIRVNIEPSTKRNNQLTAEEMKKLMSINRSVSKNAILIESVIPTFGAAGGKYRILYTTIEAETIPQQFVDIAKTYNEIWVTSDFCKRILQKYDIPQSIYVVPDTVDTSLYKEDGEVYAFRPELNSFIFLGVFGWSYRKGYDVLLKAYLQEFNDEDDVSLLIVSRNHLGVGNNDVIKKDIQKYIDQYGGANPPHIARCSKFIPEKMMPSIYRACDAFSVFTRGEGFFLPACEASLCGLPVISTNCSAQTMFLNKENSYLLDVDEIRPLEPGLMPVHYWDGQEFPVLKDPDTIQTAGKLMRHAYDNYGEAKSRNVLLQEFIADNYNIDNIANLAAKRIKAIWRKIS